MAYNEQLAERIRKKLAPLPNIEEKAMMGGLVFMYNDKMCVGIIKDELMCRVDKEMHDELVKKNGCRTMDFTNRPMRGYVLIDDSAIRRPQDFDYWMDLALAFNSKAKASKRKK